MLLTAFDSVAFAVDCVVSKKCVAAVDLGYSDLCF